MAGNTIRRGWLEKNQDTNGSKKEMSIHTFSMLIWTLKEGGIKFLWRDDLCRPRLNDIKYKQTII